MTDARHRESYWIRSQGSAGAPLVNTGFPLDGYERTKRGYAFREDLVKACKQIALDTDRTLYEVMEEAISEYLERHKAE